MIRIGSIWTNLSWIKFFVSEIAHFFHSLDFWNFGKFWSQFRVLTFCTLLNSIDCIQLFGMLRIWSLFPNSQIVTISMTYFKKSVHFFVVFQIF